MINLCLKYNRNLYYPFGLKHNYNATISKYQKAQTNDRRRPKQIVEAELDYKYKYNGKEIQNELGLDWYDYGVRNYDAAIGRFNKMDRFSEKYYSKSPYNYAANNPVMFVDIKGDSIDISAILTYDKSNKTDIMGKIITDLNMMTGMTFKTEGNMLVYDTNSDGTIKISKDADGNEMGSEEAQAVLMNAIDESSTAYAVIGGRSQVTDSSGSQLVGGDHINISVGEIDNFIKGTKGIDNRTMGYGMVFTHEILHSNVAIGGARGDDINGTGPVVDRMNIIRTELNTQGYNFGTRVRYGASPKSPGSIMLTIPFDGSYFRVTPNTSGAVQTVGGFVSFIK